MLPILLKSFRYNISRCHSLEQHARYAGSLMLGYLRVLTQQLSVYHYARVRSFIDFPSFLDIILVHFIPIILSD